MLCPAFCFPAVIPNPVAPLANGCLLLSPILLFATASTLVITNQSAQFVDGLNGSAFSFHS
jgi:hypothetical protein